MSTLHEVLNDYRRLVDVKRSKEKGRKLKSSEGLIDAEICERTGISPSVISAIMNGKTSNPRIRNLEKIVAIFIEEGVISNITMAEEIWRLADQEENFSKKWFEDAIEFNKDKKIFYDENMIQRVLTKNPRGVTLLDAVEETGLTDIENRDNDKNPLPPRKFYQLAKHEIIITGITAHTTIMMHDDELIEALDAEKELYILILYPEPKLIDDVWEREGLKIITEIRSVIEQIQSRNLDQRDNFEIRFMQSYPPFTSVMIDGDVNHKGKNPRDSEGQIRIQPGTMYGTQHRGVVFQFKKNPKSSKEVFDYFAQDVRKQWQKGVRLSELLNKVSF